ncbi:MAG: dihydroorotate dehydrogenase electron transfer subunit [Lentisphaerae bacterium]|jgi:dihydroorotate dehydrogenase electron transfer subunit|nr:dihydroorotate dehydrogenase electron transfer subunit [Lentisphaerota bacterium]MBT5606863.1 dihydroorotate dehydrogenase electron transfer subunit [Lentisphaerota bacterium]MBT7059010.1 dihydroorotate dehydrogenase electron transfer subunit [Lentisphaerota bacterium]MBT7843582.1 dihydroorotate dehydrogenase electron transfer subunit [Lentisphaerota bacterium]
MKKQVDAAVETNSVLQGDYYQIVLAAPDLAATVQPGQFVHIRLPGFEHRVLRRPFSVCDADTETGTLTVVYKVVGEGTAHLARVVAGSQVNVLGPLGIGFSRPSIDSRPVIVAGGYGCAATYLLARISALPPVCLLGGRSAGDILLVDRFEALGCDVRVSTDDGSQGHRGRVTELLEPALAGEGPFGPVYACGPNPMLRAVSAIMLTRGEDAEVSLDHVMCCGVGACFACVVRLKADTHDGWKYVRTCLNGPVFKASDICWDT